MLDFNETREYGVSGWPWHWLDYMQTFCTSLQTDTNNINNSQSSAGNTGLLNSQKMTNIITYSLAS